MENKIMRTAYLCILLLATQLAFSRSIVVGNGEKVTSLKEAISLASPYDTILLKAGVYKEGAMTITKPLTIIGMNNPVLEGENKYEIFTISGKHIKVKGIHFKNSGYSALNDFASVKVVDSYDVTLEENAVFNSYFAFHVSNSVHLVIKNNKIAGIPGSEQLTGNGIHLWKSSKAYIVGNVITGHRDGIYFEFVTHSVISNNLSEGNVRYGLHFMFSNDDHYIGNTFRSNGAGVAVMYSKKVKMELNHFENNWGASSYGILLKDISDSDVHNNVFHKNTVGIFMEGTNRIMVHRNTFRENGWAMKVQASCNENEFFLNNYFGNSFDVGTNGSLVLNKFYRNYWDKYEGYDINKDGIGDVPYHPVSMYSMIVEQNPNALILLRSFTIALIDKAEKAIPSLTPENLFDDSPLMKAFTL